MRVTFLFFVYNYTALIIVKVLAPNEIAKDLITEITTSSLSISSLGRDSFRQLRSISWRCI